MEAAAGLFIAAEVVETTIQVGVVSGYAITRPTNQLKSKFTCIANAPSGSPDSLARAHHSATLCNGDLYIYGGLVSLRPARLAGNETHILRLSDLDGLAPHYKVVPALGQEGRLDEAPVARAGHTATLLDDKLYIFGGHAGGENFEAIQEQGLVWSFDPQTLTWTPIQPLNSSYPQLQSHAATTYQNSLFIHGGYSASSSTATNETWRFDVPSRIWTKLPSLKELPNSSLTQTAARPNFTSVGDKLYLIAGSSALESQIHVLDLSKGSSAETMSWTTIDFPTNPLTPGPQPRYGACLVPITTVPSRNYLLLMFGAKGNGDFDSEGRQSDSETKAGGEPRFWSDMWSLQLPANLTTPAGLKDATRSQIGLTTGEYKWAEVEVLLPEENELPTQDGAAGKLHPGPRGFFASGCFENTGAIISGGEDAQGNCLGDSWLVRITT